MRQSSDHERFEELAFLDAIGELTLSEREEFQSHKQSCSSCRALVAQTSSLAAVAFMAREFRDEDAAAENERYCRAREAVARRVALVPAPVVHQNKRLIAAAVAASFVVGVGIGTAINFGAGRPSPKAQTTALAPALAGDHSLNASASVHDDHARIPSAVAELQTQIDQARFENRAFKKDLLTSHRQAAGLEGELDLAAQKSEAQVRELEQTQREIIAARAELAQAHRSLESNGATIEGLRTRLNDREVKLNDVTANLELEREMLSAGRDIRDIMGARELHIVDVFDTDGKGRTKKPFGRAFYTQGKSLIFYAFDLPTKNTKDGKFVYAAWGINSNDLAATLPHSLGLFYNDDQTQHRWSMKTQDTRVLEHIDTVFVTLEPAGHPLTAPLGKAILEAYFGTPPNHP
jgi:hypothetical protein